MKMKILKTSVKQASNPSKASTPFRGEGEGYQTESHASGPETITKKNIMSKRCARTAPSQGPTHKRNEGGTLIRRPANQFQPSPPKPDRARVLARAHPAIVGGVPYALLTESTTAKNDELSALSAPAALTFIKEMCPRDGLEQLAVSQALLAHARASWLTQLMPRQTDATTLSAVSEAAERAANTLGRLMRALREYREPKSATVSIAQVGQANLGHGQVVQNFLKQEVPQKIKSDEQTRILSSGDAVEAKAVQTFDERLAVTAAQHPANSALGKKHGPQNPGGKGPSCRKRTKARREKRRSHRTAKTNKGDD